MSHERTLEYNLQYYQSILEPNLEMSISIQDQQRVFLAYRALFGGQNAQIRQLKAIRRLLNDKKKSSSPLVQSLGFEKVVAISKTLLERGIFASELKAKLAFPILYQTSPEQDARHEASEAGAARVEAEALHKIEARADAGLGDGVEEGLVEVEDDAHSVGLLSEHEEMLAEAHSVNSGRISPPVLEQTREAVASTPANIDLPSLYPTQFPFRVQHSILSRVQKLLEECCFDFTTKHAPDLLQQKKWDCVEAIELNKWTLALTKRLRSLPNEAFKKKGLSVAKTLVAVNSLRHSAVHRLRTSAKRIAQMINVAVEFAEALQDSVRVSQLTELRKELEQKIRSQELNKNYLETRLKNELEEIEKQRKELDEREREAIAAMVTEDEENMHFVGSLLEDRLQNLFDDTNDEDEVFETNGDVLLPQSRSETAEEQAEIGESAQEPGTFRLPARGVSLSPRTVEAAEKLYDDVKNIGDGPDGTWNLHFSPIKGHQTRTDTWATKWKRSNEGDGDVNGNGSPSEHHCVPDDDHEDVTGRINTHKLTDKPTLEHQMKSNVGEIDLSEYSTKEEREDTNIDELKERIPNGGPTRVDKTADKTKSIEWEWDSIFTKAVQQYVLEKGEYNIHGKKRKLNKLNKKYNKLKGDTITLRDKLLDQLRLELENDELLDSITKEMERYLDVKKEELGATE